MAGALDRRAAPSRPAAGVDPRRRARRRRSASSCARAYGVGAAGRGRRARWRDAGMVVWAVKPQLFAEAAAPCAPLRRPARCSSA
ncbi:MAG: hypothetical protein MZW92_19060 [Comamonadaceae bacterium]|nr:hypothetical protein [Comamonadaceae bacterium]